MIKDNIQDLIDPRKYQNSFKISNFKDDYYEHLFKKLTLIREAEIKIAKERKSGIVGCPVHLSAGQEAIPVGISQHLSKSDHIFGAHRSHAHVLALGSSVRKLFAELLGKSTGLSKGYGGSMHLHDKTVGFMGSVPIVGGTISIAVGAGLAIKQKGSEGVAIAYLGDGAVEEGVFHESLNFAKRNSLPVLFVVENNLFSSHMDINKRQPNAFTSRFAKANLINYEIVDGNNIIEIIKTSEELIKNIREDQKPALIEAVTYRWFGHVDWREDIDVGTNRCKENLDQWKKRCPIKRFSSSLIKEKVFTENYLNDIRLETIKEINNDWEAALKDPVPEKNSLLRNVYFES